VRILVATDQWFPDRLGGVARVATDTASGWAARGHEVVVIAPRPEGGEDHVHEDGSLTLYRVLPRGRLPQTLTDPRATRRWAARLRSHDFDVVVAHCPTTAHGLLTAGLDAPLVYAFHADPAKEARYLRSSVRPGREWLTTIGLEPWLRSMTRRALNEAAEVLVLSDFSRRLLYETAPDVADRAVRVSGGVDTTMFSPFGRDEARRELGVDRRTRLLFTVRRLQPRMGLENLLEAVRLLSDISDLRLVVAGSGRDLKLARLRDRLDLAEQVSLIGRVSDDELRLWHRAADLFVLPTVAYEGFGLVTAEALASGTPVVGTRIGATPELLEPLEPQLLSRETDPSSLSDAIRSGLRLLSPSFRRRCRDYALARLAWQVVLPDWERVLESAALAHPTKQVDRDCAGEPRPELGG
jgi:glycosyltransferase involved in cell wall biosynthesis